MNTLNFDGNKSAENPLSGPTPCKENPEVYSSPLLDVFDSQDFIESHPELEGDALRKAVDAAESCHEVLRKQAVAEAVKLCRECPALGACAEWVFEVEKSVPVYGVVAGMEPHQRKKLRRRLERSARMMP